MLPRAGRIAISAVVIPAAILFAAVLVAGQERKPDGGSDADRGKQHQLHLEQSQLAARGGDFPTAIVHAERALKLKADDRETLLLLSHLTDALASRLIGAGNKAAGYQQRIRSTEFAWQLRSKHPQLTKGERIWVYRIQYKAALDAGQQNDPATAVRFLRRAIEAGLDNPAKIAGDESFRGILSSKEFAELLQELGSRPEVQADAVYQQARLLFRQRQYDKAAETATRALQAQRGAIKSPTDVQGRAVVARTLNFIGQSYKYAHDYDRAERHLRESLEIRQAIYPQRVFPRGHTNLAASLNDLGSLFRAKGDTRSAVEYFDKSLKMKQRLYPRDEYPRGHSSLAVGVANLATALSENGQLAEAAKHYAWMVELSERRFPKSEYPDGHNELAYAYRGLASALREQGKSSEALPYAQKSLEMCRQLFPVAKFPQGHDSLATSMNDVGLALLKLGKPQSAKRLFQSAHDMWQQLYPKSRYPRGTMDLFYALSNLGDAASDLGEFQRAEKHLQAALTMQQGFYPPSRFPYGHPSMVGTFEKLSSVLQSQGRMTESQAWAEQAVKIRRRQFPRQRYPDGHPDLARSLSSLGALLRIRGQLNQAEVLYKLALEINRKFYPRDKYPHGHPTLISSINNLGVFLLEKNQPAAASELFDEQLRLVTTLYPAERFAKGHPQLAQAYRVRADARQQLGELKDALADYERSLEIYQHFSSQGHLDVVGVLNSIGALLQERGDPQSALRRYESALAILERLYPTDEYPRGTPQLASTLANAGAAYEELGEFGQAEAFFQRSLRMAAQLFPAVEYPQGHLALAMHLNQLGQLSANIGKFTKAQDLLSQSLKMRRLLHPEQDYPEGHPAIAVALNNLAQLHHDRGDYDQARGLYQQSLDMRQALYPPSKYPDGHAALARAINSQAVFLEALGEYDEARRRHVLAFEMRRKLYPQENYPRGHHEIARSLRNLAQVLKAQKRDSDAAALLNQQLRMLNRLYPPSEFPQGHPSIANCLNSIGSLKRAQGDYEIASEFFRQALEMKKKIYGGQDHPAIAKAHHNLAVSYSDLGKYAQARQNYERNLEIERRLYPPVDYPLGHPFLATSLSNFGSFCISSRDFERAGKLLLEASEQQYRQAVSTMGGSSEAGALNYVSANLTLPVELISHSQRLGVSDAVLYRQIWNRRGIVYRLMAARSRTRQASKTAQVEDIYQQYLEARQQLATMALASSATHFAAARREKLRSLTQEKERLERYLAKRMPSFVDWETAAGAAPESLVATLPADTVFVDYIGYWHTRDPGDTRGMKPQWRYVAFLLAKGKSVVRVALGDGAKIDSTVIQWRGDISQGKHSDAAVRLKRLIWDPVARHFPDNTRTVFICPSGDLAALPWGALREENGQQVVLETFRVAIVPNGHYLIPKSDPDTDRNEDAPAGRFLLVGDVAYDRSAEFDNALTSTDQGQQSGEKRPIWPRLPGTLTEVSYLKQKLGNASQVTLTGTSATVNGVLHALPSVQGAHLATHGFFAGSDLQSALQLDTQLFDDDRAERVAVAKRNPLVFSGLVLAGANLPQAHRQTGSPSGNPSILTGESIAALPLSGLELVTLSACETGLGDDAGGEGVYGLQRAFHTAGVANVVASLWKVDDQATTALMRLFYHKLWVERKPALDALREAQLALYRHPEQVGSLSSSRGPSFNKAVKVVEVKPTETKTARAPTKLWAAFMLSGSGR